MDNLIKEFSSIFGNPPYVFKPPERREQDELVVRNLQAEFPDHFFLALLEFTKTSTDLAIAEEASATLKYFILEDGSNFQFSLSFLEKLLKTYMAIGADKVYVHLLGIIRHVIENETEFHPMVSSFLYDNFYKEPNVRIKIQCFLPSFLKHSRVELVRSFHIKYAELISANFYYLCTNPPELRLPNFVCPFFGVTNMVHCLAIFAMRGEFSPFQKEYYLWDLNFRTLLEKSDSILINASQKDSNFILGYNELIKEIFILQGVLLSFLPDSDPFRLEFIQLNVPRMIVLAFNLLERARLTPTALSIYSFIFATLQIHQIYRELGLFEKLFGMCCLPKFITDNSQIVTYDASLVANLKKWLLFERFFYMKSSINFWTGKLDFGLGSEFEPKSNQARISSLVENPKSYFAFDEITSKEDLRELQSLCLNLATSCGQNPLIPIDEAVQYLLQVLRKPKDDLDVDRALYLIGKFGYNPKYQPTFFNLDYLVTFAKPPFNAIIRIAATCCLFDLYYNSKNGAPDSSQGLLEIVSSNIYDPKDTQDTLSYCSIRLLEMIVQNSSASKLALSFVYGNFSKFIERTFSVVDAVNIFTPLTFIINCFDVNDIPKMSDEIALFGKLFCDLGDKLASRPLVSPEQAQAISTFMTAYLAFLLKIEGHISILEPHFDRLFLHFIVFFKRPCREKNFIPKELVAVLGKFDNFIERVTDYILSEKEAHLDAASFLNEYISDNFDRIDKERINLIRGLISSCTDSSIKSEFPLFLSTHSA